MNHLITKNSIYHFYNQNFEKALVFLIIIAGFIISLAQFLYNRSLWLDECSLALNIINKGALDLFKPLHSNQVAPILFLQIENVFSNLIPNSEYGLRLLPLLSFWTSIVLFYNILRILFKNYYVVILGLSLFVFNSTLIYYSSELKQYMTDILVITSIYFFMLKHYEKAQHKYYILGFMGIIGIFLSNVSPIILFTSGVYLVFKTDLNNKYELKFLAGLFIIWLLTFLFYYLFFISEHPTIELMISYWSAEHAFLPTNPFSLEFYEFLQKNTLMILFKLFKLGYIGGVLIGILILIGLLYTFYKKQTGIFIIVVLPIIVHLILSSLKMYPFHLRLTIYLVPTIIIIILVGFNEISKISLFHTSTHKYRIWVIAIPLIIFSAFINNKFPIQIEEIKKSINYINKNISDGDNMVLYYAATPAYNYYKKTNYNLPNIETQIIGSWKNGISRGDVEELINCDGSYWFLFSHKRMNEEKHMLDLLDSLGYSRLSEFKTIGSSAYLYDFGQKEPVNDTK